MADHDHMIIPAASADAQQEMINIGVMRLVPVLIIGRTASHPMENPPPTARISGSSDIAADERQ